MVLWVGGLTSVTTGFGRPAERTLTVNRETYLVATSGEVRTDEDGNAVLVVELCFLEHSSSRRMKLMLEGENLRLRLEELPGFMVAVQAVMDQGAATDPKAAGEGKTNRLLANPRIVASLNALCAPNIVGTPLK